MGKIIAIALLSSLLGNAQGLIFGDQKVVTYDGKSLEKDLIQTTIMPKSGSAQKDEKSFHIELVDEKGKKTEISNNSVSIYPSREYVLKNKIQPPMGFYLKSGKDFDKDFVVVLDTHWGDAATLYRHREDSQWDSQTVTDWKKVIDLAPVKVAPKTKGPAHTAPVEKE